MVIQCYCLAEELEVAAADARVVDEDVAIGLPPKQSVNSWISAHQRITTEDTTDKPLISS